MHEYPEITVEADCDALADAPEFADFASFGGSERRLDAADEKWIADSDVSKGLAANAFAQSLDIEINIRELRQIQRPASCSARPGN